MGKSETPSSPTDFSPAPRPVEAPPAPLIIAPPQTTAPAAPTMHETPTANIDVDERQAEEDRKRMSMQGRESTMLTDPLDDYLAEASTLLTSSKNKLKNSLG